MVRILLAIAMLVVQSGCGRQDSAPAAGTIEEKRIRQGLPRNIDLFNGGLLKPDLLPGRSKELQVFGCDFLRMRGEEKVEVGCTVQGSPMAHGQLYFRAYDMGATLIAEGPTQGPNVPVSGASEFRVIVPMDAKFLTLYLR